MNTQRPKQTQPLPANLDRSNASRAREAETLLRAFQQRTGSNIGDAVSDLLADLMHWCDRNGQEFQGEMRRAQIQYAAETDA